MAKRKDKAARRGRVPDDLEKVGQMPNAARIGAAVAAVGLGANAVAVTPCEVDCLREPRMMSIAQELARLEPDAPDADQLHPRDLGQHERHLVFPEPRPGDRTLVNPDWRAVHRGDPIFQTLQHDLAVSETTLVNLLSGHG